MPDNANPAPGAAGGNGNGDNDVLLPYRPIVLQPNDRYAPSNDATAVPVFYGDAKVDAGEASSWLQQVGRNCLMCGHNDRQAINFAVQRLGGPARDWFYNCALNSPRDIDARRMEADFQYWQEKFLLRYAGLRSSKDPVRNLEGLVQRSHESAERYIIRLQAAYADFDRQSRQRTLKAHEDTPNTSFIHVEEQQEIEDMGLTAAQTQRVLNICMKGARRFAKVWIDERSEDVKYEAIATHAVVHCTSDKMKTLIRKKMFDPVCNTPAKLADACREEDLSHTAPVTKAPNNSRSFSNYGQDGNKNVSAIDGEEDAEAVEAIGQSGRGGRGRGRGRGRGGRGAGAGSGRGGRNDGGDNSKANLYCHCCRRSGHDIDECRTFAAMQDWHKATVAARGKKRGGKTGGQQRQPAAASAGEEAAGPGMATGQQQQHQQPPHQQASSVTVPPHLFSQFQQFCAAAQPTQQYAYPPPQPQGFH